MNLAQAGGKKLLMLLLEIQLLASVSDVLIERKPKGIN